MERSSLPRETDKPLSVMLRTTEGKLMGGLIAETGWGWLYVHTLWIEKAARKHGYGRELMSVAEKEAVRRGCHSARLSTQSYEALPFYQRLGYQVFGELPDYPRGHTKYFLRKRLAQ